MKAFGIIFKTGAAAAVVTIMMAAGQPAHALTMQECSAKYKAAQTANTLNGMKWNDFRKAQCSDTAAAPAATPVAAPAPAPAAPAPAPKAAVAPAAPAAAATGPAVFPTALSPKYASEKPGKARMHTCVDQYNANKAAGGAGNGGLKWIQKGGGYYSECTKKLQS